MIKRFLPLLTLVILGCTTPPEKLYLHEKSSIGKELIFQGSSEEDQQMVTLILSGNQFQLNASFLEFSSLQGESVRKGDAYILYPDYLMWFNNSPLGWMEARWSTWGTLKLTPRGTEWVVEVMEVPEINQVESGALRYKDNYTYNEAARDKIHHRWQRVQASVDFLKEEWDNASFGTRQEFGKELKSLFFPEEGGDKSLLSRNKENWVSGEGVKWDTEYSLKVFPEPLRAVRDSGTLFRDFEESPALFYADYMWYSFWENLNTMTFIQKEK